MTVSIDTVVTRLAGTVERLGPALAAGGDGPRGQRDVADYFDAYRDFATLCAFFYGTTEEEGDGELMDPWRSQEYTRPAAETAAIVPVPRSANAHRATELLPYAGNYAQRTVLVAPVEISNGYISYSGTPSPLDRMSVRELNELIRYNWAYRELTGTGRCLVLPERESYFETSYSDHRTRTAQAPYLQEPGRLAFTPVNVGTPRLLAPGPDDVLEVATFLLPYFPGATLAEIARISETETDGFIQFSAYLKEKLGTLPAASSARDFELFRAELMAGVAEVHREAKKVARSKLIQSAELATLVLSVFALFTGNDLAGQVVAGITGSTSFFDLVRSAAAVRNSELDLHGRKYYVPFLLNQRTEPPRTRRPGWRR